MHLPSKRQFDSWIRAATGTEMRFVVLLVCFEVVAVFCGELDLFGENLSKAFCLAKLSAKVRNYLIVLLKVYIITIFVLVFT